MRLLARFLKPSPGMATTRAPIRKLLFATDFAKSSERAEQLSLELARTLDAPMIVLHAIEPIPESAEGGDGFEEFYLDLRRSAEKKLHAIAERCRHAGVPCDTRVEVGERWWEIVDAARREQVDLIVIGGRAFSPGQERPPIGTTSQKVSLVSKIPVLIARSE